VILVIVIKEGGEKESSIKKKEPACHELIRDAAGCTRPRPVTKRDQNCMWRGMRAVVSVLKTVKHT